MASSHAQPSPHPDAPYVVGVDLGGTNIRAALTDRAGRILQEARRPSLADNPPSATLANLQEAVREVLEAQGAGPREVVGIGIGLPGIMDSETGVVFWSPNFPAWRDVSVPPAVGDPLGLQTYILNDARCAALGELQFGAGRGARHMVMITLGTGIGGAFVVDGRLLLGPNGSIGEVGHHTIDPSGPRCGCGNFGCWEQFCARDAIIERALRLIQRGRATSLLEGEGEITPARIAIAATAGDPLSIEVMEETGFYVGIGVANLINMLNPEVFVIGGGIALAGDVLFEPLRRTVRARAVALQQQTARIVPAELGDNAGVMGGVVLALQRAGSMNWGPLRFMSISQPEDNQGLRERLQRRERQIDAVLRITEALHARTETDELARQTLLAAVETVGASDGSIFLHHPKDSTLVFAYVIGEAAPKLIGTAIRDDQGIAGRVFQSGEPEITGDVASDKGFLRDIDRRTGVQTRNMATLPLKTAQGQVIGVMQVLNKKDGVFGDDDAEVLAILSSLAASAIYTARLYQEARLAEVVNLIGDISHDIKNMVTPVVTGTQTLELMLQSMFEDLDRVLGAAREEDLAAQVREACAGVREWYPEAVHMTYDGTQATTERVREIADAIKGIVAEPHFEPANVNDVAEHVAQILRGVADRAGVFLDLSGLNGVPPAQIDKKRMYNALYNLVNNAIPETPRGGTIFLRTDLISDESGEERLQIEVADTGRGMPDDVKARLFTDQAKSTKPGGTGLGTRIVKKVVDAHRGTITVESAPGVGTTFRIRLPLRQSE